MRKSSLLVVLASFMAILAGCGNGKKELSLAELQKKAQAGDAEACLSLAQLHEAGVKGAQKDEKKAFEYYKKSAELGLIEGQYYLAKCYELGTGVVINEGEAKKWMKKAASGKSDDPREKMAIEQAKKQL